MTTYTYTTPVSHADTTGFRAWGSELNTALAAIGLVQTSDTGQINWSTVNHPGGGSIAAGYEIWRFADSTIYMKLEYGSSTSSTAPQMWITTGTGSNGSGTLTGQLSTRNTIGTNTTITNPGVTAYTSYLCHVSGYFGMIWKANGSSSSTHLAMLAIGRTVDSNGSPTSTGFGVMRPNGTSAMQLQCVRTASTAVTLTSSAEFCVVPGAITSSVLQNGNLQAYMWWMNIPEIVPWNWTCSVIRAELASFNTFSVTLVGTTPRTFMTAFQTGTNVNTVTSNAANTAYGLAILWE